MAASSEELLCGKQVSAAASDGGVTMHPVVHVSPDSAAVYKREHVLTDSSSSMVMKIRALIETWRELAALNPRPTKESLHALAKFLLTHTLNIVLSVKWMKYINEYHSQLEQSILHSMAHYAAFLEIQVVCKKLLTLIKRPWTKMMIMDMLNSETMIPSRNEYHFFVYEESAYIISMRLKKLCEDKCGDMALNLTRCYLKCCDWAAEENLNMYISDNQKKFVFDIYLSLLYQHGDNVELSNLLKTTELLDGVDMVRRFASKNTSKLWEHSVSITKLSGTIFLTRCVMLPFEETCEHLRDLLAIWLRIFSGGAENEELIASLRRIMKNALSTPHMYLFVDHISTCFGVAMRPYCVEVCIQAINTDLNLLERAKIDIHEDTARTHQLSARIADGFMRLAEEFAENLHVARECVLTSFSLQPTAEALAKIEAMARASGFAVLDTGQWPCKLHAPPDPNEDVLIKCEACSDYMSELRINPALKQANAALIEAFKVNNMGLPSVLCDDLVVIIFCVRYQMLSWSQRWQDLQRLCVMYLNDPVGTKNLITELKFVEIDYTPFLIKKEVEDYDEGEGYDVIDTEIDRFDELQQRKKRPRALSSSDDESDAQCSEPAEKRMNGMLHVFEDEEKANVFSVLQSFRETIKTRDPAALVRRMDAIFSPVVISQDSSRTEETNDVVCNAVAMQELRNFSHDAENFEIDRNANVQAAIAPKVDSIPNTTSHNYLDTLKQYNIKECSVVLTRCDLSECSEYGKKTRRDGKVRKSLKSRRKASENVDEHLVKYYKVDFDGLPLSVNRRRVLSNNNNVSKLEELKERLLGEPPNMAPVVLLKRLEESCVKSLLARVPGLNDTRLFRPLHTDPIVNVVQVAGGRPTSMGQAPNTQTSTQVSPHIQRIGQPRGEKSESNTAEAVTTANTKPTVSQSSALINILSQQIIRPSMSNNNNNARTRTAPLINIISHQTIKPARTPASAVSVASDLPQMSNASTTARSSEQQQQQILKAVVDGKLIPVTSFPSNRLLKVGTTTTTTTTNKDNAAGDETQKADDVDDDADEMSEALPKFQQAFGKSVYQTTTTTTTTTNVESTNASSLAATTNNTSDTNTDKAKAAACKSGASTVSVQPIQGGVIYTRQMPVGQTINLIQQNRGQVFRIATTTTTNTDQAIHSKMSALLAAALQGKQDADGAPASSTRIVKPVLQVSASNVIRNAPQTNLSSTTLEQLREFDMVYKQVKERSSTSTPADLGGEGEAMPQRISVTYLNPGGQKINCSNVVVVSSYSHLQPAASPALSVASHGNSSPCVTPAPGNLQVLPKLINKSSKGKTVKAAPISAAKTPPTAKPQQKPQEDEHTTQRIFDILAEYAEQLRNSPDLNNKPAPRRRSNPPTNPNQSSKRKKSASASSKKSTQSGSMSSDVDVDDPRTVGSEDSSCGVIQLNTADEEAPPTTSESNDSVTASHTPQQLILTDSSSNQTTRNLIIADSSVGEALKMPNTAVLVPGNYIMPVSMVKGGQQIAVVSGGNKILATVPARSGPNMLLFQSFLNQNRKTSLSPVKYSAIQPLPAISSQQPVILPSSGQGLGTVTLSQPIAIKKLDDGEHTGAEQQLLLTIAARDQNCATSEEASQPDSSTGLSAKSADGTANESSTEKVAPPIATPVIAQIKDVQRDEKANEDIIALDINQQIVKVDAPTKNEERVQSVLVTAGSSSGPMLSHSPPAFKQSNGSEANKDAFQRKAGKRNEKIRSAVYNVQGRIKKSISGRMDREVQQMCIQRRQAAAERELRLQKSLSEECEDLGVDEPSTSDLFPEALLFDANNSPSFDQTSQDALKRSLTTQLAAEKDENKLTLFSDDDDFIFEAGGGAQYEANDAQLCYEVALSKTGSDTCQSHSLPPQSKYMHKYTNKKKADRPGGGALRNEHWPAEISSSDDTAGSAEAAGEQHSVCSHGEEIEVSVENALSGRSIRRTIKKQCGCGSGGEEDLRASKTSTPTMLNLNANIASTNTRKRPSPPVTQTNTTTNPTKKTFTNKKR